MNKDIVYKNICDMIYGDFFITKYTELTKDMNLEQSDDEETKDYLENVSAIVIGCQLFDDRDRIIEFVDLFSNYLDPEFLEMALPRFGISKQEALERLKHGFGLHFTTSNICQEILMNGKLIGYGNNAMFTDEEDKIIEKASSLQRRNDPEAEKKLNYLYRGWGTGVSSYGSTTNGFWMYHTPESLSFLFGNISNRDKEKAMIHVSNCISTLDEEDKKEILEVMSNIYDRLIGNEQEVGCILIDRDSLKYDVDYYYNNGESVPVERRPYSKSFNDLVSNDSKISNDIDASYLKFLKIPTVIELERRKQELLNNSLEHNM